MNPLYTLRHEKMHDNALVDHGTGIQFYHGRLTKESPPRQPPFAATLHRTSPQLVSSRPALVLKLLLVTGLFPVPRQTPRFLGTWL